MARERSLFVDQEVEHGTQTKKIGFRRDILKVISKLRIHTCDTVILEYVISLSSLSLVYVNLSLSGIKHLVIRLPALSTYHRLALPGLVSSIL